MSLLSRQRTPPLIGICGRKGSGKDTVAGHLVDVFSYMRLSFADPIKKGLASMFSLPDEIFNRPELKEEPHPMLLGRTPRYLMQTLGTEWGRDLVDPDLWVRLLLRQVDFEKSRGNNLVVVPDVRFDGEAQALINAGGIIWEVVRPDIPYSEDDGHRSEVGIDRGLIETQIMNNADTRMLFTQVGVAINNATRKLYRPDDGSAV